jgi:uncharacterized OB-fold protein
MSLMPEAAEWWEATRVQHLLVQRCLGCAHRQLYPRTICTACHRTQLELIPTSGAGVVYSHSTVHRAPTGFDAPYVVAIVRLAEGPRLLTRVIGCAPEDVRCDMAVRVAWEPLPDGRNLPVFIPET